MTLRSTARSSVSEERQNVRKWASRLPSVAIGSGEGLAFAEDLGKGPLALVAEGHRVNGGRSSTMALWQAAFCFLKIRGVQPAGWKWVLAREKSWMEGPGGGFRLEWLQKKLKPRKKVKSPKIQLGCGFSAKL